MIEVKNTSTINPKILVIGIGGGGNNAVNRMVNSNTCSDSLEYVAINTDQMVLNNSQAAQTLTIGPKLTGGFGAGGNPDRGLTELGREAVRRMQRLNILPDVSHTSDRSFWDIMDLAEGPVIASHSNCRALCDVRRNLTDEQLRAIRDTGGVVGVNVSHDFVHKEPRQQTAAMLARHAAHMAEVMGPEHVACGFDFCEYFGPGYEGCEGMEDCGQAQNFFFELERIGFSEAERQAIASENLLRVLE